MTAASREQLSTQEVAQRFENEWNASHAMSSSKHSMTKRAGNDKVAFTNEHYADPLHSFKFSKFINVSEAIAAIRPDKRASIELANKYARFPLPQFKDATPTVTISKLLKAEDAAILVRDGILAPVSANEEFHNPSRASLEF